MRKVSDWIACLLERAIVGRRTDIYMPEEDLEGVMVYMEPGSEDRRAKWKKERKNDKK